MSDYIRLSRILKKIGVYDAGNYMVNNVLYGNENIKNLISKKFYENRNSSNYVGGGNDIFEDEKVKKTIIKYDGVDYEFTSYHENEMKYYHLYGKNTTCVTIIINEELKIAKIHEINNDYDCFPINIKGELKSGSTLLKLSLKLIEKVKEKYGIKYIGIHDLSTKSCHNLKGNKINFSQILMFFGNNFHHD